MTVKDLQGEARATFLIRLICETDRAATRSVYPMTPIEQMRARARAMDLISQHFRQWRAFRHSPADARARFGDLLEQGARQLNYSAESKRKAIEWILFNLEAEGER